jgi:hypothetical protein
MAPPDRRVVIGLSIVGAAVLGVMLLGVPSRRTPQERVAASCALSDAVGTSYWEADNALVITLPDTGGFDFNGQARTADDVRRYLPEILAPRPADVRAAFVRKPPASRCADVRLIDSIARAAGGRAFAAESWLVPMQTPRPD